MYSSGNTDVWNWVHLFESRCTFSIISGWPRKGPLSLRFWNSGTENAEVFWTCWVTVCCSRSMCIVCRPDTIPYFLVSDTVIWKQANSTPKGKKIQPTMDIVSLPNMVGICTLTFSVPPSWVYGTALLFWAHPQRFEFLLLNKHTLRRINYSRNSRFGPCHPPPRFSWNNIPERHQLAPIWALQHCSTLRHVNTRKADKPIEHWGRSFYSLNLT